MVHSWSRPFGAILIVLGSVGASACLAQSAAPSADSATGADRSAPPSSTATKSAADERKPNLRVLFITSADAARSDEELTRLAAPGGEFEKMRARGWKIGTTASDHLQIVDRTAIPDLVEQLEIREFPTVAAVDGQQIIRSFKSGCTTPLDAWTIGFLAKGIDERPPGMVSEAARVETTGHYPLRGNHWSIDDNWNPTKAVTLAHLRGTVHGGQIRPQWEIETWSHEELRSLHDDLHEKEMGGVSGGSFARSPPPSSSFSAGRKMGGK